MLDMNCDKKICETDLFSFMESHKDHKFFEQVLVYDMQDIVQNFEKINQKLRSNDMAMDYSNENEPKIKKLEHYLTQA